jgi:hypothetical protein
MKKIVTTIALGLLLPLSASAGQIYGSLKENQRAVARTAFTVNCEGQKPVNGSTDSYGAYNIYVGKGKCTFKLTSYQKQSPEFKWIYSSDSSIRYDFDLVKLPSGTYTLRRR